MVQLLRSLLFCLAASTNAAASVDPRRSMQATEPSDPAGDPPRDPGRGGTDAAPAPPSAPAPAPALAPVPCPSPPPEPEPCGSCAGTGFVLLLVGVGVGMVGMAQMQKRSRKMAPVGAVAGPRGKENPMMQRAGTSDPGTGDTGADYDVENGHEETDNPVHPDEPEEPQPRRMTFAERYGLPPPQPEPEPEPSLDEVGSDAAPADEFAAYGEDGEEVQEEEDEEDEYQDGQQGNGEEFDVVVDVKTSNGGTEEQNFKVKTTDTLGSVKRRMSLSMGLSPEQVGRHQRACDSPPAAPRSAAVVAAAAAAAYACTERCVDRSYLVHATTCRWPCCWALVPTQATMTRRWVVWAV